MKILFLHGLASSGAYKMADMLRQLMKPCEVLAPDLPIEADAALTLARELCASERPDLVVGLSWGGFLAQKLRGQRKALVNPDLHVSRLLRTKTGTVEYLSPRRDGARSFEITEKICRQYELLEQEEFDGLTDEERALTLGLFADGDELVRCGPEFARHYPGRAVFYPGHHLPVYPEMKYQIVPFLRDFLQAAGPSSGNNC